MAQDRGRRDVTVAALLSAMLEGLDWVRVHARRVMRPTATQLNTVAE